MLADLFHAPDPATTKGTATVGSTEACLLGEWLRSVSRYRECERVWGV